MKKILFILLCFVVPRLGFSQHLWNNPIGSYVYNPSTGAMSDVGELVSGYYKSYGSATNSPVGFLIMGSTSFPHDKLAAGFKLTQESGGVLSNLSGEASFIYRVPVMHNTKLSFGLSAVFNQMRLQREKVFAQHPDDPLLQGGESGVWGDANAGISLYRTNVYAFGIGAYNLLEQQTTWLLTDFNNQASRFYTLHGMYTFSLLHGDIKWELNGVALGYERAMNTMVYDLSSRWIFKKAFWVGGGYASHALKGCFGLYIQNFALGYAGGFGTGSVSQYTYAITQHELFLRLELNTSKPSR